MSVQDKQNNRPTLMIIYPEYSRLPLLKEFLIQESFALDNQE